jgi:aspartyl-tRNA(Asn)/glutamyl-tRNA(Gln) amidotransferase subunit B
VKSGEVSGSAAKDVFAEMWKTGAEPTAVVKEKGLAQVSDEAAIAAAVDAVLAENAKAIADFKAGNARALGALVGQVMKRMGGKANPAVVNRVLSERVS